MTETLLKASKAAKAYMEQIPECRDCNCLLCREKDRVLKALEAAIAEAEGRKKDVRIPQLD